MHSAWRSLAVTAVILGLAGHAEAATYSDRTSFNAATSGLTTVDFNSTESANSDTFRGATYSLSGVMFADTQIFTVGASAGGYEAGSLYGSPYLQWQLACCSTGPRTLTITLPTPVTAVGFDFVDLNGYPYTSTISVGADTAMANAAADALSFFGYTAATPFTTVTVVSPGNDSEYGDLFPTLDNLSFGTASVTADTPEPATITLLAVGLLGFAASARPKRRRS